MGRIFSCLFKIESFEFWEFVNFISDFLLQIVQKCRNQFLNRCNSVCCRFGLKAGSITKTDLIFAFNKAFLVVFEKHSARYTSFLWRKELRSSLFWMEMKFGDEQRSRVKAVCNEKLLKERKTDLILSFGYLRIWYFNCFSSNSIHHVHIFSWMFQSLMKINFNSYFCSSIVR